MTENSAPKPPKRRKDAGKKRARAYNQHGYHAAVRKVEADKYLDRRTREGQALLAWKGDLLESLGGETECSAQELAIVDQAVRTMFLVDRIDGWLAETGRIIHKKRSRLYPIVLERQRLVDSLAKLLGQLGLQRRARPAATLEGYLEGKKDGGE